MYKKALVKKSKKLYMFLVIFGLMLMAAGMFAEKYKYDSRFLGFGAGIGIAMIALGSVGLIMLQKKPEDTRQQEINEKDERNIKIREQSAYDTYFVTLFGMAAVVIIFLFFDYLIPCFIIIGLMSIHVMSYFWFLYYNSKKL